MDLITGKVIIFDESVPEDLLEDVLFSSASIPGVFPYVQIGDFKLVDGGTFQNLAVGDPIERCREDGYDDEDIIVDVILCFSVVVDYEDWTLEDTIFKDAKQLFERRAQIADFYNYYEDLLRIIRGYPDVYFRYAVAPSQPSPAQSWPPIFASHEEIKQEINNGYLDGIRAIKDAKQHVQKDSAKKQIADRVSQDAGSNFEQTIQKLQRNIAQQFAQKHL